MTADERIVSLEEQLKQALERVDLLQEQLAAAQKRIEELEKQKTPPPAFVKANVKKSKAEETKPRKKRDAKHNHARPRAVPTQIVEHRLVSCPDCGLRFRRHQSGTRARDHRCATPIARASDASSDFQRMVCAVSEMA